MKMQEQKLTYRDGDTVCEAFFCYDDTRTAPQPAVLISHAWGGRDEFVERKARRLAWQGYATFALDMYGGGRRGSSEEENRSLMAPLVQDRAMLARRINAALTALKAEPRVDAGRIAAIGFCFGGMCALDLARSGADLRGVASFHGLLKSNGLPPQPVKARVLVMHGFEDPLATPDDLLALAHEFSAAGADWQIHAYGHTRHSFSNPAANKPEGGMVYNAVADRRSWHALLHFLEEVLR